MAEYLPGFIAVFVALNGCLGRDNGGGLSSDVQVSKYCVKLCVQSAD